MIYNISMKIEHLLENEQAAALFDQMLPGMRKMAETNPQARQLSVEQLVHYSRLPGGGELLPRLDDALNALNTPENAISPGEAKLIEYFRALDAADKAKAPAPETHRQDAIYPGQPWLDTRGERIQAHGGAVFYEDGVYYWYGENKEHTDGKCGIWTWGLKVYSSTGVQLDRFRVFNSAGTGGSQLPAVSHQICRPAPYSEMRKNREVCLLDQDIGAGGCVYHLAGGPSAGTL